MPTIPIKFTIGAGSSGPLEPEFPITPSGAELAKLAEWITRVSNIDVPQGLSPYQLVVDGTVTIPDGYPGNVYGTALVAASTGVGSAFCVFSVIPPVHVSQIFLNRKGFEFSSGGNVKNGLVGYVLEPQGNIYAYGPEGIINQKIEILQDGIVLATWDFQAGYNKEDVAQVSYVPSYYPPNDIAFREPKPSLLGSVYAQYPDIITAYPVVYPGKKTVLFEIKDQTTITYRSTFEGAVEEGPFPMPPLPIVQIEQDGEILTDGRHDYNLDATFQGNNFTLNARVFPDVDGDTVTLDASHSFKFGAPIIRAEWVYVGAGDTRDSTITPAQSLRADAKLPESEARIVSLRGLKLVGGYEQTSRIVFGFFFTNNGRKPGAVAHPSGALFMARKEGTSSRAVRFIEGAPLQSLALLPLQGAELMRHDGTLYAGGRGDNGIAALYVSNDEGDTFIMQSAALPSGYKPIDWEPIEGGGFVVIATKDGQLFGARSFDGVTWSAPLFLYSAPSGTPKGTITQMTASGESHFIISDSQTYAIRSDDTLETAGTRLF